MKNEDFKKISSYLQNNFILVRINTLCLLVPTEYISFISQIFFIYGQIMPILSFFYFSQ